MAQWMQCDFIQITPTWADAACNITPATTDTHDGHSGRKRIHEVPGFDEPRHEEHKSKREKLRRVIELAFDPEPEAPVVAAEIREAVADVAKRLESGRVEIDWKAIAASVELEQRILAFREAFLREQQALEDDEDVALLLWH